MPLVSPILLLCAGIVLTVVPLSIALIEKRRRRSILARLAEERGCRFQRRGPPDLERRILPFLPAIGAADVRVIDLIICDIEGGAQLIVGRVDYALGSVRNKRDHTRIALFRREAGGGVQDVLYADADQPRIEQYRHLASGMSMAAVTATA
jgi:hypothetical protein